jgi:hypothetical protein
MEDSGRQHPLDQLREQFPAWEFEQRWTSAGSGPDRCHLLAFRGDTTISAWDAAGMAQAIRDYESGQR